MGEILKAQYIPDLFTLISLMPPQMFTAVYEDICESVVSGKMPSQDHWVRLHKGTLSRTAYRLTLSNITRN